MKRLKTYIVSREVLKYPYSGKSLEPEEFLSEKLCSYQIVIWKTIMRKTKRVFVYGQVMFSISNGLAPIQAIGLPVLTPASPIMILSHSNLGLSKKAIIAQVIKEVPAEIGFSEKEMDQLYNLGVECINNSLSQEELITKIIHLKGGCSIAEAIYAFVIVAAIRIIIDHAYAFHPNNQNQNQHAIVPPHLQWLYGNEQPGKYFGYGKGAGPRSITVTGLTQNAGSEKKLPTPGSWDYKRIMRELGRQASKKTITVQVGDMIYTLKNYDNDGAYGLGEKLANQLYDSIRESDTDICDIAQHLGFKADNIKNVKDHVFYNQHQLDRYEPIEHKQFDADLQQALAWKRIEIGIHTPDDVTWIKHECAERHHELKYDSGYSQAHDRAQSRYDGRPWNDQF